MLPIVIPLVVVVPVFLKAQEVQGVRGVRMSVGVRAEPRAYAF